MTVDVEEVGKFQGGRSWMTRAGLLGGIGLGATLGWAAATGNWQTALYSYLVAFTYWAGLALSALVLLMIFHAFHAKWMTVLRRPIETMASTLPWFLVLFIPIAWKMGDVYSWVHPQGFNAEQMHLLEHKRPYLNVPFFLIRTGIYLVIASFIGRRLFNLSTQQDSSGDVQLTARARRLSIGGLPFIAIVFAFAAFDWIMTLNPLWFSTMFGVYYFAGGFVSVISLIAIVNYLAKGPDLYGDFLTAEHRHNVGKLMLAFTAFWAYIGFSQFMLIWIANLPEEIPFFTLRMKGEWGPVGVLLIVGHFILPFFTLLSKNLKRNKPGRLALVAIWILLMNFVDLFWLIIPNVSPQAFQFHWSLVTAFFGIGGVVAALAINKLRGHFTLPVKDPFLAVSLGYKQP